MERVVGKKKKTSQANTALQEDIKSHGIKLSAKEDKHRKTKDKLKALQKELAACKVAEEAAASKLEKAEVSAAKQKFLYQRLEARLEEENARKIMYENVGSSGSASGYFTSPPGSRSRGGSFRGSPIPMESSWGDDESTAAASSIKVLKTPIHDMTKHKSVNIQCRWRIRKWQISSRGTT